MLLTEIVLTGSLRPSSLAICAATWSRHSHLLFRTDDGRVIDSTFVHGGVTLHPEEPGPAQWEYGLRLLDHWSLDDVVVMTGRATDLLGPDPAVAKIKYDQQGIVGNYLPNQPQTDWEKRLWCFEFGRVVMAGFLPFDHRPDRAVGRHWLGALSGRRS